MPIRGSDWRHVSDYVVLFCKISLGYIAYQSQRHIMFIATEEIRLDGYRAIAFKSGQTINLFSRRGKSFNSQYPYIVRTMLWYVRPNLGI